MIYEYDVSPDRRRLVLSEPGRPCLCLPVDPEVYEAVRACLPAQEQAVVEAMRTALRQALASLQPSPQDDATQKQE